MAPAISLPDSNGELVSLSSFEGRPVVLVFYPADESPVCSNQLALYNEALHLFEDYDAKLMGISVDNVASHRAFAQSLNLRFPLLADNDPAGEAARRYGTLNEQDGKSERALFVINQQGVIHWSNKSPRSVNPGAQGILGALEGLRIDSPQRPGEH